MEFINDQTFPEREGLVRFLYPYTSFFSSLLTDISTAHRRVWAQISFMQGNFRIPGQELPFLTLLGAVAARGVDVRLLIWDNVFTGKGDGVPSSQIFGMSNDNKEFLSKISPKVKVRWSPSPTRVHCHHAKCFIVDDISYVGGIVLTDSVANLLQYTHNVETEGGSTNTEEKTEAIHWKHDNFIRLRGLPVADHISLFALLWNGVSEKEIFSFPSLQVSSDLTADDLQGEFTEIKEDSSPGIKCHAKLLCTLMTGFYPPLNIPGPLSQHLDLTKGSESILSWYIHHIDSARSGIIVESTHMGDILVLSRLCEALDRGIPVLYIVDTKPLTIGNIYRDKYLLYLEGKEPAGRYTQAFELSLRLARHPLFCSAFVATNGPPSQEGIHPDIVGKGNNLRLSLHSKLTIVDGEHFTTGSANHVDISFRATENCGHTEVNYGISGKDATEHVLGILIPFLVGPRWRKEWIGGDFGELIRGCVGLARENRIKWKNGQPIVGHIVENDLNYYILRKDENLRMFDGWI